MLFQDLHKERTPWVKAIETCYLSEMWTRSVGGKVVQPSVGKGNIFSVCWMAQLGAVDSRVMCCVVQSVLSHTAGCSAASGIRHAHPPGLPRPEEARRGGGSGGLCQGHRSLCRETQQQGRHLVGSMERDGEDFHPCEYDLSVK